jgi:hypothetical protein
MFVRWQTYQSQWRGDRLRAVLVESVRVHGKPRQKHIAFLGSIAASDDAIGGAAGKRFWRDVTSKLDRLGNHVSPEERERILASIAAKVGGRPTDAELEQFERECEQLMPESANIPRALPASASTSSTSAAASGKYAELQLDQETMDAAFRLSPRHQVREPCVCSRSRTLAPPNP